MASAVETFVVDLARVSKRANRYLRGLSKADQSDVLATALLRCWEHRATYDPKVPLEDWFNDAVKFARREVRRGSHVSTEDLNAELGGPDTTSRVALIQLTVRRFMESLQETEKRAVALLEEGYSMRTVAARLLMTRSDVRELQQRLKWFRAEMPDVQDRAKVLTARSADSDEVMDIDRELERLEFAPPPGKDCPPCWRCSWFRGYLPARYKPTKLVDHELQTAVRRTEVQKIRIATNVRGD